MKYEKVTDFIGIVLNATNWWFVSQFISQNSVFKAGFSLPYNDNVSDLRRCSSWHEENFSGDAKKQILNRTSLGLKDGC